MLRKLLHERPWAKAFELTGLPVKRRHKNRIRLKIDQDGAIETETDCSDSDRNSDDSDRETETTESYTNSSCTEADDGYGCTKILRQNAMDNSSPRTASSGSSWASNFGYIRYYGHSKDNLLLDVSQNNIKGDCTREIFQTTPSPVCSGDIESPQYIKGQNNLFLQYQYSQSTEDSSFERSGNKTYMACEDLANMDQGTDIDSLGAAEADFLPIRRSFPHCSMKKEGAPKLWKSTEGKYPPGEVDENDHEVTSDLLQKLDPPPVRHRSHQDYRNSDPIILDPPPMFRNEDDDVKVINVNFNANVPFRKHSLNSDKRIRRSVSKSMVEPESFTKMDDQRMSTQSDNRKTQTKCECCNRSTCHSPRSSDSGVVGSCNLASPELNMSENIGSLSAGNDSDCQDKSLNRLKGYRANKSRGGYDIEHRKELTLSEIEAATYEDQCRCTSPFGSTARTSCETSVTSENVSLDVFDNMSHTSLTSTFVTNPPLSSPKIKRTSIRRNINQYAPELRLKPEPPPRLYRLPSTHVENPKNVRKPSQNQWSTLNITERTKPSLHYHMRIFKDNTETGNNERQSRVDTPRNANKRGSKIDDQSRKVRSRSEDFSKLQKGLSASPGFVVYRSDLYAHWWMKAKLPITVVNDSGKDNYFVKRYCLCITGLNIILP